MTKMTSKVLASSLVILTALGLAGCANSAAAPTTKTSPVSTKVAKQSSHKTAKTNSSVTKATTKSEAAATSTAVSTSSSSADSASTSQSSIAISSSNQAANQSSSTAANSKNQQVLSSFVKNSGVQQNGNHYYVSNKGSNDYQIEVRNNEGGDPNVAHLTGIYQYDPATGQIHQMDPITGNYNN